MERITPDFGLPFALESGLQDTFRGTRSALFLLAHPCSCQHSAPEQYRLEGYNTLRSGGKKTRDIPKIHGDPVRAVR